MLKYQTWLVTFVAALALWLLLIQYVSTSVADARALQVVYVLPMYALVTFGAYSLAVIAMSVMSVTDCPEAAKELDRQVIEAKEDLRPANSSSRPEDSQVIKKRGVVSQRHERVDVAWEVRGDLIESQNPEWHDIMDERLAKIRARLGIFDREEVEMPLRKLVLAETNPRLLLEEDAAPTRASGAFGTFVVVLPGKFEGGDVSIRRQKDGLLHEKEGGSEDEWDEDDGWWPDERDHPYYVSYAAFYDHCKYVAKPLQRGSALCLVFDLVTTQAKLTC